MRYDALEEVEIKISSGKIYKYYSESFEVKRYVDFSYRFCGFVNYTDGVLKSAFVTIRFVNVVDNAECLFGCMFYSPFDNTYHGVYDGLGINIYNVDGSSYNNRIRVYNYNYTFTSDSIVTLYIYYI